MSQGNNTPESVPSPPSIDSALPASVVWQALVREPTTGVAIVTLQGQNLWLNEQAARIFFGPNAKAEDYIGKFWRDMHDPRWINERVAIMQNVLDTGRPVMLRTIWRGRQQVTWIHHIDPEPEDTMGDGEGPPGTMPDRFLTITHRVGGDWEADAVLDGPVAVVESEVMELGPLDILSPRELEVLALIGQGLSLKEIARTLHRSYKTIENHRGSIGKKLHLDDRVKLAEIASRAGLTLADAERTRIEKPESV
ncbi:MAG: hypothetical protein IT435_04735 [Phycisphaerales bacterium]|nr:hypothetical protein [Phycisphaerales bacterium]